MTRTVLQSAPASVAAISPGGMATSQAMDNTLVTPAEIQWGPGQYVLPKGAQVAILYGDPTKDGLFSMRFKLPKGYRVPPHTLSKAGTFTVISGTFRIGMGERVDPTKVRAMPARKLYRASARQSALRVRGRGDGGSTQQDRTVGARLQRSERRPAPEAEVTLEESIYGVLGSRDTL